MFLVHLEHVEFDLILAQVDSLSCLTTVEVVCDDQKSEILGEKSSFQPTLHRHKVVRLSSHVVDLSLQLRLPEVKIFETLPETLHRLFLYTPNNTAAVPFFQIVFIDFYTAYLNPTVWCRIMATVCHTNEKKLHCESKNWATFIFTVTMANVGRF